jgi:hypothetical protein
MVSYPSTDMREKMRRWPVVWREEKAVWIAVSGTNIAEIVFSSPNPFFSCDLGACYVFVPHALLQRHRLPGNHHHGRALRAIQDCPKPAGLDGSDRERTYESNMYAIQPREILMPRQWPYLGGKTTGNG